MPQPLRGRNYGIIFSAWGARQARPELMAYMGSITVMWAEIEAMLGEVFADILGTEARIGVAVLLALRAEAAQREVLRAAAELKLSKDKAAKLALFLQRLRDSADGRNRVAHGRWGYSSKYPDALIYMDPKDHLRHRSLLPPDGSLRGQAAEEWQKKSPKMLLYRERDFLAIAVQLADLQYELTHLSIELRGLPIAPPPEAPAR